MADSEFPTYFQLQNEEYERLTPAQKLKFLEREMEIMSGRSGGPVITAPAASAALGPQTGPIPDSYVPTLPPGAQSAPAEGPFRRRGELPIPLVTPLERADLVGGAALNAVGDTIGGPASQEWWQGVARNAQPGIESIREGKWARGTGQIVRSLGQGADSPGLLGRQGLGAVGGAIPEFFTGLLGEGQEPAVPTSVPASIPVEQTTQMPAEDPFGTFLKGMFAAYDADMGTRMGGLSSTALGGGGGGELGETARPSEQDEGLKKSRTNLENYIAALAQQSTLPEPVFKERLANVLVGAALGYARSYGQTGDVGQGLIGAGAGGGAGGLEYNREIEERREKTKQENLRRTSVAAGLSSDLYRTDVGQAQHRETTDIARERTRVLQRNALLSAQSRLQAALAKNSTPGDKIEFAMDVLKTRAEFNKQNNPALDTEIQLQTGEKMKIRDIADPTVQSAYLAAIQTAAINPPLYQAKFQEAMQIIESQKGGAWNLQAMNEKPEEIAQRITRDLLVQYYLQNAGGQPQE